MFGDFLLSLVVLIASIYLYIEATGFKQLRVYQEVGPDFWPKIILACLIILSTILTSTNLIKWHRHKSESKAEEGDWKRVLIAGIICVSYVFVLKLLGFFVASIFFIIGMMLLINPGKKKMIPLTCLGIIAIIYVLFSKLLFVPLPKGMGIFRDLSILLGL